MPSPVQNILSLPKNGTFCRRKINRNNSLCNRFLKINLCFSPQQDESSWALQKEQRGWGQSPELTFLSPVTVKLILLGLCKTPLMSTWLYVLLLPHHRSCHWRCPWKVCWLVGERSFCRCCRGAALPATWAGAVWGEKRGVVLCCYRSCIIGLMDWKGKSMWGPEPGADGSKSPQRLPLASVWLPGRTPGCPLSFTRALMVVFSNASPSLRSLLTPQPGHCSVRDPGAFCLFLGVLHFLMRRESSVGLVDSQLESLPSRWPVLSTSTKLTLKRANKFYAKSQSFHRCTDIQKWLFHIWDLSVRKVYIIL